MSWQDDIQNIVFTIITGDGKEWTPKWKNAIKDLEFNVGIYEFVEVDGSLALREKMKGRRFDLEFYFDGDDSVNLGNAFELSARDSRAWTIKHPFYGNFKCQPLNLRQDNTQLNTSKFTGTVIETITDTYPKSTPVIQDEIISKVETVNEKQAQAFEDSKELDRVELAGNVEFLDMVLSAVCKTGEDLRIFKEKVSDAVIEISNTVSTALSITRAIQALINYPATIEQTVEARFVALKESLQGIIDSFTGNKNQYEMLGGSLIASMQLASVSNITTDYDLRRNITDHQERLATEFNSYMSFLDGLQTERADSDDSYIPNFTGINALSSLVSLSISNLYDIAFSAKQEREFTLEKDNNIILLTHRFYGLDKDDINIERFITTNNIGLNEILNIHKGRKIIYYV